MPKKFILSGFTALRAIRKLRIEGYCFKELSETDVLLPSEEEVQKMRDIFDFSATNRKHRKKYNVTQKIYFLADSKCRQKPPDNAVFTHLSGS